MTKKTAVVVPAPYDHSDAAVFARAAALAALPDTVTGYLVMENGRFGGAYTFPRNKDKEAIHWPPGVVALAPPDDPVPAGQELWWDGSAWDLRDDTKPTGLNSMTEGAPTEVNVDAQGRKMPVGVPVADAQGRFPITVLNAEGTEWVWQYPPSVEPQ